MIRKSNLKIIIVMIISTFLIPYRAKTQEEQNVSRRLYNIGQLPERSDYKIDSLINVAKEIKDTKPDSALYILNTGYRWSKTYFYPYGTVQSLSWIGYIYFKKGNYGKAMQALNEAELWARADQRRNTLLIDIYRDLGTLHAFHADYNKASEYLFKTLHLSEKNRTTSDSSKTPFYIYIYNNLGNFFASMPAAYQPESRYKAMYYYNKAAQMAVKGNHIPELINITANKGELYLDMGSWKEGFDHLNRALEMVHKTQNREWEYTILYGLAKACVLRGQPRKAVDYLQAAANVNPPTPYNKLESAILVSTARLQLGEYDKAEASLGDALRLSQEMNINIHSEIIYENLSIVYEKTGRPQEALQAYKKYKKLEDSIISRTAAAKTSELEVKYRTLLKDREISEKEHNLTKQKAQIQQQRFWITVTTSVLLLIGLSMLFMYFFYRQKQKTYLLDKEKSNLKALIEGEEKERARLARELHDGVGGMLAAVNINLNSIREEHQNLFKLNTVIQMVEDTATEVRRTAHNMMPDILIKHGLKNALFMYCDDINQNGNLEVNLHYYGTLENLGISTELMIYRIIQELVQNILKHAKATYAEIQLMSYSGRLNLLVEDNGTGFDPNEKTGFGMENLRYRVQSLQGILNINSSKERSTAIHIEFDIEKLKAITS